MMDDLLDAFMYTTSYLLSRETLGYSYQEVAHVPRDELITILPIIIMLEMICVIAAGLMGCLV